MLRLFGKGKKQISKRLRRRIVGGSYHMVEFTAARIGQFGEDEFWCVLVFRDVNEEYLLEQQRKLARENPVIMDGRDIGTVVLPDASIKIFLTAAPEARAMRRYKELMAKGIDTDYDTVLAEVKERDYRDSHRETAPLRQAEDAVLADTTELDFQGSVELLASIIGEKLNQVR